MADDITISAKVDTSEARRDLDKLTADRTVDVELQPVNVEKAIAAISKRLDKLNTDLIIAVAEDNQKNVKSLEAKIRALSRRKTELEIEVEADTTAATAAIDRAAQDQTAEVRVTEDGASQVAAEIDRAAADETATIRVEADTTGVEALLGGLSNLPGVGGLLEAAGGADALAAAASGLPGALGPAAAAAGAAAGTVAALTQAFDLAVDSVGSFGERAKDVERLTQVTGASADEASRLVSVMGRYGAEVGDIADVLLNIQGKAADGSLEELGVQLDPGATAVENLRIIADAYARLGTDSEKAALASAALGEEGARQFVPLIEQGADEMERLFATVDEGQLFNEDDLATAQELRNATREVGDAWDSVKLAIGKDLAPTITDLLETIEQAEPLINLMASLFSGTVGHAVQFVNTQLEATQGLLQGAANVLDTLLGPLADFDDDLFGTAAANAESTWGHLDIGSVAARALADNLSEANSEAEALEESARAAADELAGILDPLGGQLDAAQAIADVREAFEESRQPVPEGDDPLTALDQRQLGQDAVDAAREQVLADIDSGVIQADQAIDALRIKLGELRNEQVELGISPESLFEINNAIAQLDRAAETRQANITVTAQGLQTILDQLAQIQDKTITISVDAIGAGITAGLTGNWSGGTMRSGELARVAEHGAEVFEGRSGQRLVLRGDGAFMAPEAGRVVSGAETARRYPHLVGGGATRRPTGDVHIHMETPDARLAAVDTHRTWQRIMGSTS